MKRFSFRTFTTFLMAWTFSVLILSGIALFVSPPGRVAHWDNWTLVGLTKEGWQGIHTLVAVVFLVGGIFHLLRFNWKVFVHYLKRRREGFQYLRELAASFILFGLVLTGTILGIPPFSSLIGFGESMKASWENGVIQAPMPHFELLSLDQAVAQIGLSPDRARSTLAAEGFAPGSETETLKDMADRYSTSPSRLFQILAGLPEAKNPVNLQSVNRSGLGRRTIREIADELGVPLEQLIEALDEIGASASPDDQIKDAASRLDISPHDLLNRIEKTIGQP